MTKKITIPNLLEKVKEVNKKRKAEGKKLLCFGPVLKEEEIKIFEDKYEISLPEEFRDFLMQVGNGNNVDKLFDFSEYHHLDTLQKINDDYCDDIDLKNSKIPFPFGNRDAREIILRVHYQKCFSYANSIYPYDAETIGCIMLNYAGWSTCYTALVVTGEQKGKIWFVNSGNTPFYSTESLESFTFLEWVNDLLEDLLHPGELILTAPEKVKYLGYLSDEISNKISWKDILKCRNLERVNFTGFKIEPKWEDIGHFIHLKELIVNNYSHKKEFELKKLPESIKECKKLEVLNLAHNSLETVPDWIGDFPHLKTLDLYWNPELKNLPETIKDLSELLYLNIGKTAISKQDEKQIAKYLLNNKRYKFRGKHYSFDLDNKAYINTLNLEINQQSDFEFIKSIGNIDKLQYLSLTINSDNIELPKEMVNMVNLKYLGVRKEVTLNLKETINQLPNLQDIYVENSSKLNISDAIGWWENRKKVKPLKIEIDNIISLETDQQNHTEVLLYINDEIPDEIGKLSPINELSLNFRHKKQAALPSFITTLKALESISVINSEKIKIPSDINNLNNLSSIEMKNVEKLVLPATFKLLDLEYLNIDLSSAKTDDIIDDLYKLPASLKELTIHAPYINGNKFFAAIQHCTELTHLNVSTREIPAEIECLKKLKSLIVLNCEDEQVNHDKPLTIHPNLGLLNELEELDLQEHHLSEFPLSICNLSQLKKLNIDDNQISSIPKNIKQLTNLKKLNLCENKLKEFPEELTSLQNLEFLDLSSNQIVTITENIVRLQKLKILYLYENEIKEIPDNFLELKMLENLDVDENVIVNEELANSPFLRVYYAK